jgi:hypothetical protein
MITCVFSEAAQESPVYHLYFDESDLEVSGDVIGYFVGMGNFDKPCLVAVTCNGGVTMKFGLQWNFGWDSEGVETATVTFTDEKGKKAVGISFNKKVVAGYIGADDLQMMIRANDEGFPSLKLMYSPDLVKREKVIAQVVRGVSQFVTAAEKSAAEVKDGE